MIFDAHSDIWTDVLQKNQLGFTNVFETFHRDRLKQAGVTQGVFTIWADPPYDTSPEKRTCDMFRSMFKEIHSAPSLRIVKTKNDFIEAEKTGQFAALIAMEGLASIGSDVDWLYALHAMGIRSASLTWNEENALATGAKGTTGRGLTEHGRQAVALMEKLGILLDVSHINDKSFDDIAGIVTKPFIASHSNCRALCGVQRNLTDDQIRTIAKSGGVIGMNAFKEFVDPVDEKRTLDRFIDHMVYLSELVGTDHVGFGFDFFDFLSSESLDSFAEDETNGIIGFEDISKAPILLERMRERGFNNSEILDISYRNFRKVYERVL